MKQSISTFASLKRFFQLRLKSGFGLFLIKSVILVAILVAEYQFFPRAKALVQLNILGRTPDVLILFVGLIFFALERYRLYDLKKESFEWKTLVIFFPIHLAFFLGFFVFKGFLISNPQLIEQYFGWWVPIRYLFPMATVIFLGLSLYGMRFTKKFFKSLLISFVLAFAIFHISFLFQYCWRFFSTLVTVIVHFLLQLSFPDTFMNLSAPVAPRLEAAGFGGSIETPCSGIESLSLFILLYTLIIVIDRKLINKKRVVIAFIFGLPGMFLVNVLRIYLLFLAGILINPQFATHQFHTNIGWVLFLAYFAIFWLLSYNWLRRKN